MPYVSPFLWSNYIIVDVLFDVKQGCKVVHSVAYIIKKQIENCNKKTARHIENAMVWRLFLVERVTGIEPVYPAWEAGVLPLNYTRRFIFIFTCINNLTSVS